MDVNNRKDTWSQRKTERVTVLVSIKIDASLKLKKPRGVVAGTPLESDVHAVNDLLQTFRFDLALERLRLAADKIP